MHACARSALSCVDSQSSRETMHQKMDVNYTAITNRMRKVRSGTKARTNIFFVSGCGDLMGGRKR